MLSKEEAISGVARYTEMCFGLATNQYHGLSCYHYYDENMGAFRSYVKSYTGAHADLYVYAASGEMYEEWTNPITDELEPATYSGSIYDYLSCQCLIHTLADPF